MAIPSMVTVAVIGLQNPNETCLICDFTKAAAPDSTGTGNPKVGRASRCYLPIVASFEIQGPETADVCVATECHAT